MAEVVAAKLVLSFMKHAMYPRNLAFRFTSSWPLTCHGLAINWRCTNTLFFQFLFLACHVMNHVRSRIIRVDGHCGSDPLC